MLESMMMGQQVEKPTESVRRAASIAVILNKSNQASPQAVNYQNVAWDFS